MKMYSTLLNKVFFGIFFSFLAANTLSAQTNGRWTKVSDKSFDKAVADASGNVYAFQANSVTGNSIMRWDGATWTNLGTVSGVNLNALATDANNLYIGGYDISSIGTTKYNTANILKWNFASKTWIALPDATFSEIQDGKTYTTKLSVDNIAVFRGVVYIQNDAGFIYKLEGTTWKAITDKQCKFMTTDASGNNLYTVLYEDKKIARYNGTTWTIIDQAFDQLPRTLSVDKNNNIYVGGLIQKVGTTPINYIAKHNGTQWSDIANTLVFSENTESATKEGCATIAFDNNNNVYAGASFSSANNAAAKAILKLTGTQWTPFETGIGFTKEYQHYCQVLLYTQSTGYLYACTSEGVFRCSMPTQPQPQPQPTKPANPSTSPASTQAAASSIPTTGKSLNGSSDFVSLPTTISAGLSDGSAVTIEYWFKGTNIQSAVRLQSGGGSFIVAGWGANDPQHIISTDGNTNGVKIKIGVGVNLYDNKWHHVAMTWEKGKPDGFKSYVDGALVAKRAAENVALPTFPANTPTIVGAFRNNNANSELTNGQVARVRIWKVARTEAQIKESKDKAAAYPTDANLLYQSSQATPAF